MRTGGLGKFLGLVATGSLALAAVEFRPLEAQQGAIAFETDLPRVLVFISETGEGDVATRDVSAFLREAGFPLVDPALAHTAAGRELVASALGGDEGAAVQLGRDFGAQVLIIGRADWGARPSPIDASLITATSEVELRALRLDEGNVVATARGDGRSIDATEQAARTKAVRSATDQLLQTSFMGQLMNNWGQQPWREASYWRPDAGAVPAQIEDTRASGQAPGVAISTTAIREFINTLTPNN